MNSTGLELGEELLTVWFLAFLAVAWIVVYLPSVWRARQRSPFPAVQSFKRSMRTISPRARAGRYVMVPEARDRLAHHAMVRAQQRRKIVLGGLLSLVAITGLWALLAGGNAVEIHLIVDALTAFYVAMLLDSNRKRAERVIKVRTLHGDVKAPEFLDSDGFEILEAGGGRGS